MPTFMGHLGVKAKVIRFQGAWAKRLDSMSDTYLREAQVIERWRIRKVGWRWIVEDSADSDASMEKDVMGVLDCLVTCGSRTPCPPGRVLPSCPFSRRYLVMFRCASGALGKQGIATGYSAMSPPGVERSSDVLDDVIWDAKTSGRGTLMWEPTPAASTSGISWRRTPERRAIGC